MVQVTIVLNKIECLEELLKKLSERGLKGGTVIESSGMARILARGDDAFGIFSSLKDLLDLDNGGSRTIFMIADESQVKMISETMNEVTGGLEHPNTGILFCTPLVYIEGLRKNKS
ncbi:MAG: hypothetical protein RSB38_07800 [Oscillospiraceae bacterium]